jgi:hypothetical protein
VPLSKKQLGVLKGMMVGIVCALAIVLLGASMNPFAYDDLLSTIDRLSIAIMSGVIPVIFLAVSIGRMAKHRFFTPEDIDGGGLSVGTERAIELQSLLQNTMEQVLFAIIVYCAWSVVMPVAWLSVVPIAAIAFGLGRILFFVGYKNGAPSRAVGFTLSFYPSMAMLIGIVGMMFWQQIS